MTVDELVTKYRGLPEATVKRLRIRPHLREECLSAAWFALYQSAVRFKPNGRAAFTSYALWRIRGAVIDSMRDQNIRAARETRAHAEAAYQHPISLDSTIDLERALSRVSTADRDLLVGKFVGGVLQKDLTSKSKSWNSRLVRRALARAQEVAR